MTLEKQVGLSVSATAISKIKELLITPTQNVICEYRLQRRGMELARHSDECGEIILPYLDRSNGKDIRSLINQVPLSEDDILRGLRSLVISGKATDPDEKTTSDGFQLFYKANRG